MFAVGVNTIFQYSVKFNLILVKLVSLAVSIHFLSETKTSGLRYFRNVVGAALTSSLLKALGSYSIIKM